MINVKAFYNQLFEDSRITALVPEDNIFNAYPETIETFPALIFVDESQNDIEYADNKSMGSSCSLLVHIYSKKLNGYPTTSQIGIAVAEVMNENWWNCSSNGETAEPVDDVEHRIMRFSKSILY